VRFETPEGWLTGEASYRTEPSPSGTVFTSRMQFQAHGFATLLEPLLSPILPHDSRRDEKRLKRLLEGGEADRWERALRGRIRAAGRLDR
jgi:hypothetical protein